MPFVLLFHGRADLPASKCEVKKVHFLPALADFEEVSEVVEFAIGQPVTFGVGSHGHSTRSLQSFTIPPALVCRFSDSRAGPNTASADVTLDLEAMVSIICALEVSAKLGGDSYV